MRKLVRPKGGGAGYTVPPVIVEIDDDGHVRTRRGNLSEVEEKLCEESSIGGEVSDKYSESTEVSHNVNEPSKSERSSKAESGIVSESGVNVGQESLETDSAVSYGDLSTDDELPRENIPQTIKRRKVAKLNLDFVKRGGDDYSSESTENILTGSGLDTGVYDDESEELTEEEGSEWTTNDELMSSKGMVEDEDWMESGDDMSSSLHSTDSEESYETDSSRASLEKEPSDKDTVVKESSPSYTNSDSIGHEGNNVNGEKREERSTENVKSKDSSESVHVSDQVGSNLPSSDKAELATPVATSSKVVADESVLNEKEVGPEEKAEIVATMSGASRTSEPEDEKKPKSDTVLVEEADLSSPRPSPTVDSTKRDIEDNELGKQRGKIVDETDRLEVQDASVDDVKMEPNVENHSHDDADSHSVKESGEENAEHSPLPEGDVEASKGKEKLLPRIPSSELLTPNAGDSSTLDGDQEEKIRKLSLERKGPLLDKFRLGAKMIISSKREKEGLKNFVDVVKAVNLRKDLLLHAKQKSEAQHSLQLVRRRLALRSKKEKSIEDKKDDTGNTPVVVRKEVPIAKPKVSTSPPKSPAAMRWTRALTKVKLAEKVVKAISQPQKKAVKYEMEDDLDDYLDRYYGPQTFRKQTKFMQLPPHVSKSAAKSRTERQIFESNMGLGDSPGTTDVEETEAVTEEVGSENLEEESRADFDDEDDGEEVDDSEISPREAWIDVDSEEEREMIEEDIANYEKEKLRTTLDVVEKKINPYWRDNYESLYDIEYDRVTGKAKAKLTLDRVLQIDWEKLRNDMLDSRVDEETICRYFEREVVAIVRVFLSELTKEEVEDISPTESTAFLWLYSEYDAFSADDGELMKKLLVYPHIVKVCQELAILYAANNAFDIASDLASQTLDLIVFSSLSGFQYTQQDVIRQWKTLRKYTQHRRLSHSGRIEYLEKVLESGKIQELRGNVVVVDDEEVGGGPSDEPLEKRVHMKHQDSGPQKNFISHIETDLRKLKENEFERVGGVVLAFLMYFLVVFFVVRCALESSCEAPTQRVLVEAHSFDFYPPLFSNAWIDPCARSCFLLTAECTCEMDKLSCPDGRTLGDYCICEELMCDKCNICGLVRKFLRRNMFLLFFLSSITEIVLFALALMFVKFPEPPLKWDTDVDMEYYRVREANLEKVSLIIPTTGSNLKSLEETVQSALELFRPGQIIICHHGGFDAPVDGDFRSSDAGGTYRLCQRMTGSYHDVAMQEAGDEEIDLEAMGRINYVWVGDASKMMALYMASVLKCTSQYLMIVREDVTLPRELYTPVNWMEEDEQVQCLTFYTRASHLSKFDGAPNRRAILLDLASKVMGVVDIFQSRMGSVLFPNSDISLWKRDLFISVLERHNTSKLGEDMQLGLLVHKLNKGYRMKSVANVPVPITQSNHLVCFPAFRKKAIATYSNAFGRILLCPFKCREWGCEHHQASVFYTIQNMATSHFSFWFGMVGLSLFVWNRATFILKMFILNNIWNVFMDFVRIPLLILIFMNSQAIWTFVYYLGVLYVMKIFLLAIMDVWTFRQRADLQTGILTLLLYPLFEGLLVLFRQISAFYNIIFVVPRKTKDTKIKNRLRVPVYIDGDLMNLSSERPDEPSVEALEIFASQTRHVEIRGLCRSKEAWVLLNYNLEKCMWQKEQTLKDSVLTASAWTTKKENLFSLFLLMMCFIALAVFAALLPYDIFLIITFIFVLYIIVAMMVRHIFA